MSSCIFCQIVSGKAAASVVYEDDFVLAIMDIDQPNPYKVLGLSKAHRPTIYDLDDATTAGRCWINFLPTFRRISRNLNFLRQSYILILFQPKKCPHAQNLQYSAPRGYPLR
ncbi:MAG: hypothetical protein GXP37_10885 [Chloroflexi bacterium]|nr:hypothetical protein [Chloroflexota bacterium]